VSSPGGTRTCIHTPGEALDPAELALPCSRVRSALAGAALAYFDGRLAEAAALLAGGARAAGVPVLVEGERLRPGLDALLAAADYVTTSAHFPQARAPAARRRLTDAENRARARSWRRRAAAAGAAVPPASYNSMSACCVQARV